MLLMLALRHQARRGHYGRAARIASALAALRRDPATRDLRDVWRAAHAWALGDPRPAQALRQHLIARDDPRGAAYAETLALLTRDWQTACYGQSPDAQVRARCELSLTLDAPDPPDAPDRPTRLLTEAAELAQAAWNKRPGWLAGRQTLALSLPPLAFWGRLQAVEETLRALRAPKYQAQIWRATAQSAAGHPDAAREALNQVINHPKTPPAIKRAALDRLTQLPPPRTPLTPEQAQRLQSLEAEAHAADQLRLRLPWTSPTVLSLTLALLLGYLLQHHSALPLSEHTALRQGALVGGHWPADPTHLLRYGFLHANLTHLLVNLTAVLVLGPILSRTLGNLPTLLLFPAGILTGGIAIAHFGSPGLTIGASAGAMTLAGALLATTHRKTNLNKTQTGRAATRALLTLIALQTLADALMPNISLTGHLTGALTGLLLTTLYLTLTPKRAPPE